MGPCLVVGGHHLIEGSWPFFCMQNNRHVQSASSGRNDL